MAWFQVDVRSAQPSPSVDQLAMIAGSTPFDYSDLNTEVTAIPQYMFYGCTSINDIISSYVTSVGGNAFNGATKVGSISLPNCTSVGAGAFSCGRSGTDAQIVSIDLRSCTSMNNGAFLEFGANDATAELSFPALTTMGTTVFSANSATKAMTVKSISLPAVTSMGSNCFNRLVAETVDIGENCTNLGSTPFANATVTNLIVRNTTPPTLGSSAGLGNGANITHIYVPEGSVETYKQTNRWSAYASIIEKIPSN